MAASCPPCLCSSVRSSSSHSSQDGPGPGDCNSHCSACRVLAPYLTCTQADVLRKALLEELDIQVGKLLGVGGISVCFEASPCEDSSAPADLLAVKISHKAGCEDLVADMAQVSCYLHISVEQDATCSCQSLLCYFTNPNITPLHLCNADLLHRMSSLSLRLYTNQAGKGKGYLS